MDRTSLFTREKVNNVNDTKYENVMQGEKGFTLLSCPVVEMSSSSMSLWTEHSFLVAFQLYLIIN